MNARYKKWSDEEVWKAWFFNRKGYSVRAISEIIGRTKQATSCKMSNDRLYYHPPKLELPEGLEIEFEGEKIHLMEENILEIEKAAGRI
jgi:hypothetical protein